MIADNIKALARRYHAESKSYREIAKLLSIAPNSVRNIILDNTIDRKKRRGPKSKVTRRQTISILREIGRIERLKSNKTAIWTMFLRGLFVESYLSSVTIMRMQSDDPVDSCTEAEKSNVLSTMD